MTVERVPLADAVQRVFDGDIRNASAVVGLLAAAQVRAATPRLRPRRLAAGRPGARPSRPGSRRPSRRSSRAASARTAAGSPARQAAPVPARQRGQPGERCGGQRPGGEQLAGPGVPVSSRARGAGLARVAQPPRQPAQQQPAHRQHDEDDGEDRGQGADGVLRGLSGAEHRAARVGQRVERRRSSSPTSGHVLGRRRPRTPCSRRPSCPRSSTAWPGSASTQHRAVHRAGDQHPEHDPGEHADVGGELAGAEGGVLGVEAHRRILRSAADRARRSSAPASRSPARAGPRDRGRAGRPCLDSGRGAPRPGAPATRWRPVTPGAPAETRSPDDAGRGSPRGQEP